MASPSTTSTDDETSATNSTVSSAEFNRNGAGFSTDELDKVYGPTRRTVSEELSSIPIVADTLERVTDMVSAINTRLENNLPFYGWSIATMMCTYQGITSRAANYSMFLWLVTFYRGALLDLIDFVRRNYPEIDLPASEMRGRFVVFMRRQIALATSYLASFRLSQTAFRALEIILKTLENFCNFLILDRGRSLDEPWWNLMDHFLQLYELTINRFLRFMSRHMRVVRYEIKHIRRSGAYVVARNLHIRSRRRVSPRKSGGDEKPRKGGWLCFKWLRRFILAILGLSRPMPISTIVVRDHQPNSPDQAISSTEKKRKLSAVDEERSYDTEGEMTHHALLTGLETYNSEEDPNYAPTDTSTDSYEYRTSDEEEEEDPTSESGERVCTNEETDKKKSGKDISSSKAASKEIVPKTGKAEGGKKDKKAAKKGKDKGTKSTPEENGVKSSPEDKDKKAKQESEGKKKK